MFKKFIILSIISICFTSLYCNKNQKNQEDQNLPQIDLYFETLCPGCQYFITNSFQEFLNNPEHSQLAKVNFHPYGNAIEEKKGSKYEFTCQHGETECYGNTVEVCALNKLPYEEGLNYIICMEKGIQNFNNDMKKALESCIEDAELKQNILTCAENEEGNELQHQVALDTPNHDYVPWITYNGEHNEKDENRLMDDMIGFLCDLEVNKNKDVCINYVNKNQKVNAKEKDYEVCENISPVDYAYLKFLQ